MEKRLPVFFFAAAMLAMVASCFDRPGKATDTPLYLDDSAPIEQRIEDALSRMTLDEKIKVIHAQSKFSSAGVPRLGIPELWCTDGPHGIRTEVLWDEWDQAGWTNDSCIAFPALTCLASTWNREMAALYGKSIGEEAAYRGKDVLLGPGLNINRTPLNGRNFEYMGEDPYLAGEMAVPYIQGVQSNGVATCVKHFALNNEETNRHTVDVDLSDRALYEIYLPAYKKAVQEGGTWSIMGSYNLIRGQHSCHNEMLLCDILRGEWGFDGTVISDWGGVHDTNEAAKYGMDLEFGTWTDGMMMGATDTYDSYFLAGPYREKIKSGDLPVEGLDEKVRNVLRLMMRTSMNKERALGSLCSDEHYEAARHIGDEGIVLLKNDGKTLPVKLEECKSILVVGENAVKMMTVGGGSSSLKVQHEISPLEGICNFVGDKVEIIYARGYAGSTSNSYNGVTSGQDLTEKRSAEELISEAVELASKADFTVFVGGLNKDPQQDCEGDDRTGIELPYGQDKVIEALAEVTDKLAVIFVSGNAVAMPWIEKVPAIMEAWYLGSEAGNSIADILFGAVNPSGKLPCTFPVALSDIPAHKTDTVFPHNGKTWYGDDIFVGYRGFEKDGVEPLFAFGHGLSYTEFEYSPVRLSRQSMTQNGTITISVDIKNIGDVAGAEVVQLYISDKESRLERPEKELKGFEKIYLSPGEKGTVQFTIDKELLQYFDDEAHEWTAEPGEFVAHVASASDDIRSSASFSLAEKRK